MAAGIIVIPSLFPARDRFGWLVPGAKLGVYVNQTTTKAAIFSDEALTTPLDNPVVANSSGQFPLIWTNAGTTEAPVLYTVSISGPDGQSIANPSVFHDWQPSLDGDTAAVSLATAAAENAQASAVEAETSYQNVLTAIQAAQDADGDAALAGAIAGQAAGETAGAAAGTTAGAAAGAAAAGAIIGDKANRNADNISSGLEWRTALRTASAYTAEQFPGATYNERASAAATAAFAAGVPVEVTQGTATVDLDVQGFSADPLVRWTYLQSYFKWAGSCRVANNARLRMRLTAGPHDVTVNRDADGVAVIRWTGENPTMEIDRLANPVFIALASPPVISARTGDVYTVTIVLASAAPVETVVGAPFGMSNIKGDNDAEALSGGGIVKTISPDRLTITYDMTASRTADLVSPTTINTTDTDYSMQSSRAVFFTSWLSVDTNASTPPPGWNGVTDTEEGVFQFSDGGRAAIRGLAMVWRGSFGGTYYQDLIFGRDNGTHISIALSLLVGAPEKGIRLYGNAKAQVDQSYISGGAKGEMGVMCQNGASIDVVQSCIGGFRADCAQSGVSSSVRLAGAIITSGEYGLRALGGGTSATSLNCRFAANKNQVFVDQGAEIQVANTGFSTFINRGTVGLTRAGSSLISGNPTFSGNTTNSNAIANLLDAGGLWNAGDATGLLAKIGPAGTEIKEIRIYQRSINIVAVAANSTSIQTFTVPGLVATDIVVGGPNNLYPAGLVFGHMRVSAVDTIELNLANITGASVDQGAINYTIIAYKI